MRALALHPRLGLRPLDVRVMDVAVVLYAVVYAVLLISALAARIYAVTPVVLAVPWILGPVALFSRRNLRRPQAAALGFMLVLGVAALMTNVINYTPLTAIAIPLMVIAAIVCARFPAPALVVTFLIAGAFGSLQAFLSLPSQKVTDVLLGGLWLAAVWGWAMSGRERRPQWLWPGVLLLLVYGALSMAESFTADPLIAGLQGFRGQAWYIVAVPLIAWAPWPDGTRQRLLKGVLLIIAVVGAYATLRWSIGPAGQEEAQSSAIPNNFLDGELRPVGSFLTTKELASWSAFMLPFAAGMAVTSNGRTKLLAALAFALCGIGLLAADVRGGVAAAVPGVAAVIVLYQLSQAFRGRRGPAVAIAVAVAIIGGGGAFVLTLGDKTDSANRYEAILHPSTDASYQARLIKWHTVLDSVDQTPFGHGLGSAGRAQTRYGDFVTIGSVAIDNSYLKIAYEQGVFVMVLFGLAALALLIGLARRAVTSADPARAGPAIAAVGTLVAMLVIFFIGEYVEGLQALSGWILVGLGVRGFSSDERAPQTEGAPYARSA